MKRTLAVIASLLFSGSSALAQHQGHSADAAKPPAAAEQGMHGTGGMHGMSGMQEHMKLMREQMAQIRGATDPKERERLMSEHMKTMEQSMAKMQGMGCGGRM